MSGDVGMGLLDSTHKKKKKNVVFFTLILSPFFREHI